MLMWPLMGVDPVPGRVSYPLRLLLMFLMLPFHAFLGISIMSAQTLIAERWYLAFNRSWPPSPLRDQYIAGGIMWGSGDFTALMMLIALFVRWYADSQREARAKTGGWIGSRRSGRAAEAVRSSAPGPGGRPPRSRHSPGQSHVGSRLSRDGTNEVTMSGDKPAEQAAGPEPGTLTILLYASDRTVRENVRLAIGRKVAADLPPVRVLEVATQPAVITAMDAGGIDLVDPRRRGRARRHGPVPAAEGRDRQLPTDRWC